MLNRLKDFVPRLKDHLLPRIKAILEQETMSASRGGPQSPNLGLSDTSLTEDNNSRLEGNSVLFKSDRMYRHNLLRLNYTTYDIRRSQDVVNPETTHCDIMLLANPDDMEANSNHPFLYARVLGIYHVNVVYVGMGMLDYTPRRLDFIWVRWFGYSECRSVAWKDCRLDSIRFPPMASNGAFGFVDPRDVLRGCHIIPRFAKGKVHSDGIGLSRCAGDTQDWQCYYVNRCGPFRAQFFSIQEADNYG